MTLERLSDADWLRFDEIVDAKGAFDSSVAYGFMAGVAIHPDPTLTPNKWLGVLFADVVWEDQAEVEEAFGLAMRVYNDVIGLARAHDFAMPTLDLGPELVAFCRGFVHAIGLTPMWEQCEIAHETLPLFAAVAKLESAMLEQEDRRAQIAYVLEQCGELSDDHLRWALQELTDEFEDLRLSRLERESRARVSGTVRRTEEKIGRNDPCPCGSGRKFKRCCGN